MKRCAFLNIATVCHSIKEPLFNPLCFSTSALKKNKKIRWENFTGKGCLYVGDERCVNRYFITLYITYRHGGTSIGCLIQTKEKKTKKLSGKS